MRTFIFFPDWYEFIQGLNDDKDKFDLYSIIVQYGCCGYYKNDNKKMINVFESMMKKWIDTTQANYEKKKREEDGGKASLDIEIKRLAGQKVSAKDIAKQLGVSVSTVYHSQGWKQRNQSWEEFF